MNEVQSNPPATNNLPNSGVPALIANFLSWATRGPRVLNFTPLIPHLCYRGHGRGNDWKLLPKLCRGREGLGTKILSQDENDVVSEFRNRFHLHHWTCIEILAYAQHYGAPTRLLDWTRNPFVGLWFSVADSNHDKVDGVVYQLRLYSASKIITAMTEPPKNLVAGRDFKSKGRHSVHVFSSPLRVERGERQASVFSLAHFRKNTAITPLDELLKRDGRDKERLRKFSVPAEIKPELRKLLAELGLDAFSMYGGPDALGKSILSRLYTPAGTPSHI